MANTILCEKQACTGRWSLMKYFWGYMCLMKNTNFSFFFTFWNKSVVGDKQTCEYTSTPVGVSTEHKFSVMFHQSFVPDVYPKLLWMRNQNSQWCELSNLNISNKKCDILERLSFFADVGIPADVNSRRSLLQRQRRLSRIFFSGQTSDKQQSLSFFHLTVLPSFRNN